MANENAVTTVTEQNQITAKLLNDYFATLTDKLTDVQRNQFAAVAQAFGLNPFKREIYATTYKNRDGGTVMSIVTGYEVYLKRAEMNPNYNGFETEVKVVNGEMGCTCKVYRKDRTMPVTSTVWMGEYNTGRSLWATKPRMMLEKVAIATAFRRAFPCDFGGMPYTTDELPEHMTGADKLNEQGYKEVPQDAPKKDVNTLTAPLFDAPAKDDEFEGWKAGMIGLAKQNGMAYKKGMADAGFKDLESVPPEMRNRVFNHVQSFVSAYAMANNAAAKSAPTAMEQAERPDDTQERDF